MSYCSSHPPGTERRGRQETITLPRKFFISIPVGVVAFLFIKDGARLMGLAGTLVHLFGRQVIFACQPCPEKAALVGLLDIGATYDEHVFRQRVAVDELRKSLGTSSEL